MTDTRGPVRLPLATECDNCGHNLNWHMGQGDRTRTLTCDAASGECGCLGFKAPAPMDPVHILGIKAAPTIADTFDDMTAQTCPAGEHADWAVVSEHTHPCPWCDLEAERAAHEAHRLALSEALHLGTSAPWDAIQDRAETVQAGDAPWVRAYGEDIAAAEEVASAARQGEAEAIRARTASDEQARVTEEERVRVLRLLNETEKQLGETRQRTENLAGQAKTLDQRIAAYLETDALARASARRNRDAWRSARHRAAERTAVLRSTRRNFEMKQRHLSEAEATIAAVRELHANDRWHCGVCADEYGGAHPWPCPTAAALGDPQPAVPVSDPCAHGCRDAADAHTRISEDLDTDPEVREQTAVPEATPSAIYNLVTYIIERQWNHAARTTDEIHADIEPLLAAIRAEDGAAEPQRFHVHLDNRGATYQPWPDRRPNCRCTTTAEPEADEQPADAATAAVSNLAAAIRAYAEAVSPAVAAAARSLGLIFPPDTERSGD